MEKSFLFLLLSYTLTQPSPRGRGRLPKKSWHTASVAVIDSYYLAITSFKSVSSGSS